MTLFQFDEFDLFKEDMHNFNELFNYYTLNEKNDKIVNREINEGEFFINFSIL